MAFQRRGARDLNQGALVRTIQRALVAIGLLRAPWPQCKDTATNILATGEFVVNLVSFPLADALNVTCMDAPPNGDELSAAKLQAEASVKA